MWNLIDYTKSALVPVYDIYTGKVAFSVIVYGVTPGDLLKIGPGCPMGRPVLKAVERLRLDPQRYLATVFDVRENQ